MSILPVKAAPHLPKTSIFEYLWPQGSPSDDNRLAFVEALTERRVTRGQVYDHALRLAQGMINMGMKAGDVACIHGLNSIDWVNAMMGCFAARVICSPANFAYSPKELLYQINDAGASMIFVDPTLASNVQNALQLDGAPQIPNSRIILLCPKSKRPASLSDYKCIEEIWADEPYRIVPLKQGEEHDTISLLYSSGTTGRAKGVESTHWNFTSQIQALNTSMEPLDKDRDIALGMMPFGHAYLFSTGINVSQKIPMVIIPRFQETDMLKAIEKYKVTWILLVPPILIVLLNSTQAQNYNLKSLRAVMSAAAPLGTDLVKAFTKKFGVDVTQGYGLTEISPISHVMTIQEAKTRPGSVGRLLPTLECKMMTNGENVKSGERGEIWIKGPSVMKGYWKNKEATDGTFADKQHEWFMTGDIGVVDPEGFLSIVDRVKELIKYKGYQVPPAELEAVLLTHPQVADAAVIGILSKEEGTELPRAYVVVKPINPSASAGGLSKADQVKLKKDISDFVASQVANYKRLRGGVVIVDSIPKSPSGKILRKELRVLAQKEGEGVGAKL